MIPNATRAMRQSMHAVAFDKIGDRYDEAFPNKEGQEAATEWLIDRLPPGGRVLDVGCGTGAPTARRLSEAGFEVTGIDISEVMLELARRNAPRATFLRLDMVDVDESLGTFDAIVGFFSVLMLSRMEIPMLLRRFRDLLVPGGIFLLSMVEEDLDEAPVAFLGHPVRVSAYPRGVLGSTVARAGFEILDLRAVAYTPVPLGAWPEIQLFLYCRRDDH
ncbi:class I SAM-dependent methyltransferase [Actinomadura sp. HBU206391]|uniref:class I SAM-dependent methyltransferase n=1 Tax=Actinomadura sp. HBU206391 TaxID=2731692 RepID=UPI0021C5FA19|nr:class I SAM-dependent methyltransferase [Actinomadura sp. HBU206391]